MLHFVTSYMKQNKSRKQTLENAQYGLEMLVLGLSKYVKIVKNGGGFTNLVLERTCPEEHPKSEKIRLL